MDHDFERDIRIDPTALDVEWVEQPKLLFRYSELLADARYETDRAKEALDVIKAEVDADIRANPVKFTGEDKKPTEGAILQLIVTDERVRKAERDFAQAKREQGLLQAAVSAVETRKYALENLVRLIGQRYFSSPLEPRDLEHEVGLRERQQNAAREGAREKAKAAGRRGGRTR